MGLNPGDSDFDALRPNTSIHIQANASNNQQPSEQADDFEAFDWSLYSALIRKDRKDKGYKTADAFSATIYRRTRVNISRDSIYKIEQGKQTPDALQFMAINISLYGDALPGRIVQLCFCSDWREISEDDHGDIPQKWKIQNFYDAAGSRANDPNLSPEQVANNVGDAPGLFFNPNFNYSYDEDIPF